jgi:hypothetical protein
MLNLLELAGRAEKDASLTSLSTEYAKLLQTPEATDSSKTTDKQTSPKAAATTTESMAVQEPTEVVDTSKSTNKQTSPYWQQQPQNPWQNITY